MNESSSTADKALFFTLGAMMGAAIALLLAPRSGEETRRYLAEKARDSADYVTTRGRDVVSRTGDYMDKGKEILQQQREQLSAALEAGKQAYREEKDKSRG